MTTNQIIRLPAVIIKTSLSKSSIYRLESLDQFPKRVRLGENSTGWLSSEIDEFITSRPRVSASPKKSSLRGFSWQKKNPQIME